MKQKIFLLLTLIITLQISGCAHVALSQIPQNRANYNLALNDSDNQQFLLNIVRIHYGLSPYFIGVDTITTQSTLTIGTGDNSQINTSPVDNGPTFWTLNPELSFSQTPTITYTPLQGNQFVSALLTTIPSTKISLLLDSGWSIDNVLQLTLSQIGNLENNTNLAKNTNSVDNNFTKFTRLLQSLYDQNLVDFQLTSSYAQNNAILVTINNKEAAGQIAKLLDFKKTHDYIILTRHYIKSESTPEFVVPIKTRSFYGIMNYLSGGITDQGLALAKQQGLEDRSSGSTNKNYAQNLFKVKISNKEPSDNVLTKVSYEGQWFYITNDDIASKSTLSLIRMIFSMQLGDINRSNLPIVTIPIR